MARCAVESSLDINAIVRQSKRCSRPVRQGSFEFDSYLVSVAARFSCVSVKYLCGRQLGGRTHYLELMYLEVLRLKWLGGLRCLFTRQSTATYGSFNLPIWTSDGFLPHEAPTTFSALASRSTAYLRQTSALSRFPCLIISSLCCEKSAMRPSAPVRGLADVSHLLSGLTCNASRKKPLRPILAYSPSMIRPEGSAPVFYVTSPISTRRGP